MILIVSQGKAYYVVRNALRDKPLNDLREYLDSLSATPTASVASTVTAEGSSRVSDYTLSEHVEEMKRMEAGDALRTPPVTRSQTARDRLASTENILDGLLSPVGEGQEEDVSMLGGPIIPMGDLEHLPDEED